MQTPASFGCLYLLPLLCFPGHHRYRCNYPKQFTLNGRVCSKGKVDFTGSMPPGEANDFYDRFVEMVKEAHAPGLVKDGVFGAKMDVSLVNDGPITVVVDSGEMKKEGVAPMSGAGGRSGVGIDDTNRPISEDAP